MRITDCFRHCFSSCFKPRPEENSDEVSLQLQSGDSSRCPEAVIEVRSDTPDPLELLRARTAQGQVLRVEEAEEDWESLSHADARESDGDSNSSKKQD